MTTFARIVGGFALDCRTHASATELSACFHPDWLATHPFAVVPDGTLHGAVDNGNGTFTNPKPIDVTPQPNTPGNPYFGKKPLPTQDFYALVGQALPADRFKRLLSDSHFLWIGKVIDNVNVVDPDDRKGQFLKIVDYLINTKGDDNNSLMEKVERDAIMAAWSL